MCLNIAVRTLGAAIVFASVLLGVACGGGGTSFQGAKTDAGSGSGTNDSGVTSGSDAGGGSSTQEGGANGDAGPVRFDQPLIACNDEPNDVYLDLGGLPTMTNATRGDVIACAPDGALGASDAQAKVLGKSVPAFTATSGVNLFRVEFRTWRGNGAAGLSSARVYLPTVPHSTPLPLVVIAHPTTGMGAGQAPSMDASSLQDLALPFAALGYAVIAPDYAGLGTPGVQGYVDNHDTAYSILDAARALRKMMAPGVFSTNVIMAGHSQGGGGVLSAQALASTYGLDGDLAAVAVFAPEWPTRLNSFDYQHMIENPNDLTITTGVSNCVVAAYREYAYFSNYVGASDAADAFPSAQASTEISLMGSLDQTAFGGYLHGTDLHIGDMFDSGFRTSLAACIAGTDGCNAREAAYFSFLKQNVLTADPTGAKVLYVQGLLDEVMTPAEEAACNVQKLVADGVTPTVCVDASASHTDVTPKNISFGISWLQAVLAGTTPPTCASSLLPPCNP